MNPPNEISFLTYPFRIRKDEYPILGLVFFSHSFAIENLFMELAARLATNHFLIPWSSNHTNLLPLKLGYYTDR